jgi:hypothetical protein
MTAVVITGAGLVCPTATGPAGLTEPDGPEQHPADWFDPVHYLGRLGWKYLTPATRYLLAAAGGAIADARLDPEKLPGESMGVVVGTSFAARPVVARLDEVVRAKGAEWIRPAEAPNFSVNIPASHISMKYGMQAFNLTLTDPLVAGLAAVLTLASAIRRGRAELGVAGATEERPDPGPFSDAACCLVLESAEHAEARGAAARTQLAGGFCRFVPPRADPRVLVGPIEALLSDVDAPVRCAVVGEPLGGRLAALLAQRSDVTMVGRRYLGADGRYATASPLLQAVGLLTEYGQGLVLATSPHGHVAAVRLR